MTDPGNNILIQDHKKYTFTQKLFKNNLSVSNSLKAHSLSELVLKNEKVCVLFIFLLTYF